jgi:hypothetical protein
LRALIFVLDKLISLLQKMCCVYFVKSANENVPMLQVGPRY